MRTHRFSVLLLLALSFGRQAAAAPEQWVEVTSSHFTLFTDAGEKQGRKLLDQFERMRWVFHTLLPNATVDPAIPLVVVAAKNETSFIRFLPADRIGKGQMQLGGYFTRSADRNYILLRLNASEEHPFATVYHEYTHLMFASADGWMPIWLNEGWAEFFQNTDIEGKDVRLGQPSADNILYLREHSPIPLDVLFRVDQKSPYYHEENKGSVFYAESWALTHYLAVTDREHHTNKIGDYISLVSQNVDPVAAAEKAFGNLRDLQSQLQSYMGQASYSEFVLNSAAAQVDESSFKVQPVTPSQADALRADILVNGQRLDEARTLLDAVLKADPNNVQAQEAMGMLAFRQGNMEEARKWFGDAVKLNSQDFFAYYFYARFSMGSSGDESAAEANLRTAIRLNPRFAPSYDGLAAYYGMRHEKLDEAHLLDLQAIELDPSNIAFRVNAAGILMEMERYDDAEHVLQAAAAVAKTPADAAMVQSQMERIEQFRAEREQEQQAANQPTATTGTVENVVVDIKPKYPNAPANGVRHSAEGVMHGISCSYPREIEFRVETAPGKSVFVYNNDMSKMNLTAVGFTPSGTMNPCSDFEGRKARVQYMESADKSVDGEVTDVELRK